VDTVGLRADAVVTGFTAIGFVVITCGRVVVVAG
jgi:hypothetical protein